MADFSCGLLRPVLQLMCAPLSFPLCCFKGEILEEVRTALALDRDDPTKEDKVKVLRGDINSWVATYRREPKVSGRPSYG